MEEEVIKVIEEPTRPVGRAALLEMYRTANPGVEGDPDDESLLGFAHDRYSELDGRYNELSGANTRLSERVAQDPRFGAVLSMMHGEDARSFPYAMGRIYGRDWIDADPEEFERGYQDQLARLAESRVEQEKAAQNFQDFLGRFDEMKTTKGLTEEQGAQLLESIYEDAENFLMGIVPQEYVEYKWKGMNYDKDVEEAAITGEVEGRNQQIEVRKRKVISEAPLPDMASGTGAGRTSPARERIRGSFFDELKEES